MGFGRTLLAIGALAGLLGGTMSPPATAQEATPAGATAATCPEATDAELERIARAWSEEFLGGGDLAILDEIVAPNLVHRSGAFAERVDASGLAAIQETVRAGFPDAEWTVELVLTDAPLVATRWTARGTFDGEFQGIAPTGETVTWQGLNVFRVACGRIVESWTELDQIGRLQQLGALPADDRMSDIGGNPAATADPASPASCPAADEASVETAVRTWWEEGWTAGDAEALRAVAAADLVHHWATGPDAVGPAALTERIGEWRAAMPDLRIDYDEILVDGDHAAGVWTVTGTDTGGVMGAAPTGAEIAVGGINVFRLECGRIAEVWSETDVLGLREQLGSGA